MASIPPVSPTLRSKLLALGRRTNEPKGSVLFRRNQVAFGIFLICKGRIRLQLDNANGNGLLNREATRDSIVGLPGTLSGGRYSLTAVAAENSEVAFVARETLLELIKSDSRGIGIELIRLLGEEVVRMREVLVCSPVH